MTYLRRLLTVSVEMRDYPRAYVFICLIGENISGVYLRSPGAYLGWLPWWLGFAYQDYARDCWIAYPKPFHLVARFLRFEYYEFLRAFWDIEFERIGERASRQFEGRILNWQLWAETRGL